MNAATLTSNFPRRTLGRQGPTVSAIGLGCMGMSDFYGPSEEADNLALVYAEGEIVDDGGRAVTLGDAFEVDCGRHANGKAGNKKAPRMGGLFESSEDRVTYTTSCRSSRTGPDHAP